MRRSIGEATMVGNIMDREVTEGLPVTGSDEMLAPNNRVCVLFDGHIAGFINSGRDGKKFSLFTLDGTTLRRVRACNSGEDIEIRDAIDQNVYNVCETVHVHEGCTVTFVTL